MWDLESYSGPWFFYICNDIHSLNAKISILDTKLRDVDREKSLLLACQKQQGPSAIHSLFNAPQTRKYKTTDVLLLQGSSKSNLSVKEIFGDLIGNL